MLQQATLWRFLKRDSSGMDSSMDAACPTPKRVKSSTSVADIASAFSSRPSSMHASSRTLSSPTLSKMDCDDSQMILDCGQKRFGPELCSTCGMCYSPTNGNDLLTHQQYHRQLQAAPRFRRRLSNGSLFVCLQEFSDGFIYKCCFASDVLRQNRNYCQQAIEELFSRMNDELGETSLAAFHKDDRQLYLFVGRSPESAVLGVLIADHVKFAYRYSPDGRMDEQPNAAAMGVNRVWTWPGARRRRIATRMVDCARCNFYFGAPILKKHVAFSEPTTSGLEFARKYCESNSVLVYRFA